MHHAPLVHVDESVLRKDEQRHPKVTKQLAQSGKCKQSIAFNLLRRLPQHTHSVLLFIRDPTVPFTNNLAERAVRCVYLKPNRKYQAAFAPSTAQIISPSFTLV